MFSGLKFGASYFVWYGKDGETSEDNADKYVYTVSNNGHLEEGDNYIRGRVLRSRISDLNSSDWQFYIGSDGMLGDNWTLEINGAKLILQDSMICSMTGMT